MTFLLYIFVRFSTKEEFIKENWSSMKIIETRCTKNVNEFCMFLGIYSLWNHWIPIWTSVFPNWSDVGTDQPAVLRCRRHSPHLHGEYSLVMLLNNCQCIVSWCQSVCGVRVAKASASVAQVQISCGEDEYSTPTKIHLFWEFCCCFVVCLVSLKNC